MSNKRSKNTRRVIKKAFQGVKGEAINDWCEFINAQKLGRRIKLAFLVICGSITYEKLDRI